MIYRVICRSDHSCSTSANNDNLLPAILEQCFVRHGIASGSTDVLVVTKKRQEASRLVDVAVIKTGVMMVVMKSYRWMNE